MTVKEKAEKLYKSVNTFILSCVDEDGYPHTKAVSPGKFRENLKELYFCTNTSSKFASAITNNNKVSVYFYSHKFVWKGCLLIGKMEIITDMILKEKYWQNKFKNAYAEKSCKDPDFCLVKFTPISGRFYSWFKSEDFKIED